MCKIIKPFSAQVVNGSGTIVLHFLDNRQMLVRQVSAIGNDASAALTWTVPKAKNAFKTVTALATDGVVVNVPVDAAGGIVRNGVTLDTTCKLLLPVGTGGYTLATISSVAAVSGKMYAAVTISAAAGALPVNSRAWVVRAWDIITGLPAVGAAAVGPVYDFIGNEPKTPILLTAAATGAGKSCIVGGLVEYYE